VSASVYVCGVVERGWDSRLTLLVGVRSALFSSNSGGVSECGGESAFKLVEKLDMSYSLEGVVKITRDRETHIFSRNTR
jgi:hypothetical protein